MRILLLSIFVISSQFARAEDRVERYLKNNCVAATAVKAQSVSLDLAQLVCRDNHFSKKTARISYTLGPSETESIKGSPFVDVVIGRPCADLLPVSKSARVETSTYFCKSALDSTGEVYEFTKLILSNEVELSRSSSISLN